MNVLFEPTPKQQEFINACFSGKYKFLFYGGAAGGGKTYVGIAILILLCRIFPNSRWCVVRKTYEKLKLNTLPSFHKLCPRRFFVKYVDHTAHFTNGSQIIFKGENFAYDKDLTWMDGLEVNGFLFEEGQELHKKLLEKAKLRAGRHIIPNMPPILIMITGNPSQNWTKDIFVDPWKAGTIQEPYFFLQALMDHNPHLPKEYKESLETLDSMTYQRYVLGNWDVIDAEKPFAYGWNDLKHINRDENGIEVSFKKPVKTLPIYVSFDFNVDPITAIVAQHNSIGKKDSWIRFHKEYRLKDSNIYALCQAIKRDHEGYYMYITGDASGQSRSAMTRENLTYYRIIKQELGLRDAQIMVPTVNPAISNNRVLVNSLLEKHPSIKFDKINCPYTVDDLRYVEVDGYGDIDKTKDKHRTHLLDCVRYYFNTFHAAWLKYKL